LFFFQAEDGIRDFHVTGVQTCALPISGLVGLREQREALMLIRDGVLETPPVELVWWNLAEDRLERASLPARRFEVQPDPLAAPPVVPPVSVEPRLLPWQLSTGLLTLTTLLGFGLWWRARRQPAVPRQPANAPNSRSLLDEVRRACLTNEPGSEERRVGKWA